MLRKIAVIVSVVVLALLPLSALASPTAVVTVVGVPGSLGGISNFVITYTSDTQLDLSWTLYGDAVNIMIRGKYGSYPADIPNQNTTPSDGYLVYYGSGSSVSDTSMNFDQNPGLLYYKAWAQKADGTWYTSPSSGKKESKTMALLFLLGFGSLVSYFAIRNRNLMMAVIGSALWVVLLAYTRSNPISGTATGDTTDNLLIVVCIALIIAVPLISWQFSRNDKQMKEREDIDWDDKQRRRERRTYSDTVGTNRKVELMKMSDADYAAVLRARRERRK